MKIVKNSNNEYAIKKGWWIFTRYCDLTTNKFWLKPYSQYIHWCWGSKQKIRHVYQRLKDLNNPTLVTEQELMEDDD